MCIRDSATGEPLVAQVAEGDVELRAVEAGRQQVEDEVDVLSLIHISEPTRPY